MEAEDISVGIEQLVDHLRTNQSTSVNLGDIASVTEVLLATMRRYFNSIDTTLYSEFRGLSEYIERARSEISELRPNDLKQERIPRAGLELEAIVTATENATGTIMDAAEEIMSADATSAEYADTVNEACMRIFEACSFQDITGQRITKVVATLTYIEERLHGLQDAWGPDIADADGDAPDDDDIRPDSDLLNGPALDGEGIQQDQIDSLLTGGPAAEAVADVPEAAVEAELPAPESNGADPEADASQADIDALFNGDAAFDEATPEPEVVADVPEEAAGAAVEAEAVVAAVEAESPAPESNGADPEADVSQADIDALFNGDANFDEATPEPEAVANEAPVETVSVEDGQPALDDIVALTANSDETSSQDDIDALFD
jgi:hypothetical protein